MQLLSDLEYILQKLGDNLFLLKNTNIFITGGTGFIGKWLLESIIYANSEYNLNIKVTVLSRDVQKFCQNYPLIAKQTNFVTGDIRDFRFPDNQYTYIIHAATEANANMNIENPLLMSDVIINGTHHVLDFARHCMAKSVLFLSSGAVYGIQPNELTAFTEEYNGAPNPLKQGTAYGESKRMAEFLCATYCRHYNIKISIARCFAFIGPYLDLDSHFAIGNFIRDGLKGKNITVTGDGLPKRSYMYVADLIVWLWLILLKGNNGDAYNVGSNQPISIRDLAYQIAEFFPDVQVKILNQIHSTDRNQNYIPDIQKAKKQFNLNEIITLKEAINKTIQYHKQK